MPELHIPNVDLCPACDRAASERSDEFALCDYHYYSAILAGLLSDPTEPEYYIVNTISNLLSAYHDCFPTQPE